MLKSNLVLILLVLCVCNRKEIKYHACEQMFPVYYNGCKAPIISCNDSLRAIYHDCYCIRFIDTSYCGRKDAYDDGF